MSAAHLLSDPIFDSFTVELKPGLDAPVDQIGGRLLAEHLGGAAAGWEARAIHPSLPTMIDLLPPEEGALTVKEAWDLTYRLRLDARVLDAEPAFDLTLDNVGDPAEAADGDLAEPLRRAMLADDEDEDPPDPGAALSGPGSSAEPTFDDTDPLWSPKMVRAFEAWQRPPRPGTGAARGRGVVIGHPDAGFRRHGELFSDADPRVHLDRDRNFVERDRPDDAEHEDAGHGLATASVIMSRDNPQSARPVVTGAAPEAELIPFRVAKKRGPLPVPVLLRSGQRRLREAVFAAIDADCHVISISLGWLWNRGLHEAIKEAVSRNIIVCAAAGNYVRLVVWPAAYPETIAVAGCTARRAKWKGSSRGRRVDVTAPAKAVWRAVLDGGDEKVEPSKGTSYAVALTAGLAALWLAHWGRDFLLQTYGDEFHLATVFRRLLKKTCDSWPPNDDGKFGSGIVNADRLLAEPLPTVEELRASSAPDAVRAGLAPAALSMRGVSAFAGVFEEAGRAGVRSGVSELLDVPAEAVDGELLAVGDELMFHLVTQPALRESFAAAADAAPAPAGEVAAGLLMTESRRTPAVMRGELLAMPILSDRLRGLAAAPRG